MATKYDPPTGPPPSYPQAPAQTYGAPDEGAARGYYSSPPPQGAPYGYPPQQQAPYGYPPQQYGQPQYGQQPMYYQQQPPPGAYGGRQSGSGAEGICAGIMGALACCCCLDFCIF